jgi:hypothetical protein
MMLTHSTWDYDREQRAALQRLWLSAAQYVGDCKPYPAWGARSIPLSIEMKDVFVDLQQKFSRHRSHTEYGALQTLLRLCSKRGVGHNYSEKFLTSAVERRESHTLSQRSHGLRDRDRKLPSAPPRRTRFKFSSLRHSRNHRDTRMRPVYCDIISYEFDWRELVVPA